MYFVSDRTKESMSNLVVDSLHFTYNEHNVFVVPLNQSRTLSTGCHYVYSNFFVNLRNQKISFFFFLIMILIGKAIKLDAHLDFFFSSIRE